MAGQRLSASAGVPVALTIAGSDSSAGAGIQADLKTFAARGVYGVCAVTCIVAETPGRVSRIQPADAMIVREQMGVLARAFPIGAAKTGLLCNGAIAQVVARAVRDEKLKNLVVDPVMVATSGDVLLDPDAVAVLERELFPLAALITPNLDEAARLLNEPIRQRREMERAALALASKYRTNVLLKGGHLRGSRAIDLLSDGMTVRQFSATFIRNVKTHGTGCTYSAAIAAGLAHGLELPQAIAAAKRFITRAIRTRLLWNEGRLCALNHQL